ncbi:MAG: hypothetical protein WB493_14605, partial [Anaeromyxobacteraceae bacterium]
MTAALPALVAAIALAGAGATTAAEDLPPPLPPPHAADDGAPGASAPPGDALDGLWSHRIDFEGGEPVIA